MAEHRDSLGAGGRVETSAGWPWVAGFLSPGGGSVAVDAGVFRAAVQKVAKGIVGIVGLVVMKWVIGLFLKTGGYYGRMSLHDWIAFIVSLAIAGTAVTLYRPVCEVTIFFLTALVRSRKMPGSDRYMGNLAASVRILMLLVFVVAIYLYLESPIDRFSRFFLKISFLTTILNVLVLAVVVGLLYLLWRNAQPLIDLLTGHITDRLTAVSGGAGGVACGSCNSMNVPSAAFCASCGARMEPRAAASVAAAVPAALEMPVVPAALVQSGRGCCAGCGAENGLEAMFCFNCGTKMEPPAAVGHVSGSSCSAAEGQREGHSFLAPSVVANSGGCPGCGAENPPGAGFCYNCGKRLGGVASAGGPIGVAVPAVASVAARPLVSATPITNPASREPQPSPEQIVSEPSLGVSGRRRFRLVPTIAITAGLLLIVAAGVYFLYPSSGGSGQGKSAFEAQALADGYRPCNLTMEVMIEGMTTWFRDGGVIESGEFKRLLINNREIQVVTNTFEDGGFIQTKDFGKILVKPASAMGGLQVYLKPEQEEKLAGYLAGRGTDISQKGSERGGGAAPAGSGAESEAWDSAVKSGTPAALVDYCKLYPNSSRIKTVKGTVRGRYWCRVDGGDKQNGVLVTVKGTSILLNLSLEEAKRLGFISSRLATSGLSTHAEGQTFNYVYVEMTQGGYIVARKVNGVVVKEVIEPRDFENSTIILSADGTRFLGVDSREAKISANPDTNPTFVAAAVALPPFNDVPSSISKEHTPESQKIGADSRAD